MQEGLPDPRQRAAQRAFRESGTLEQAEEFFHRALRSGALSADSVDLLAHLGFQPAARACGPGTLPRSLRAQATSRLQSADPEQAQLELRDGVDQLVLEWFESRPSPQVLAAALREVEALGGRVVWLDLPLARGVPSAALPALLSLSEACRRRGGSLIVTRARGVIGVVIELLGLEAFVSLSDADPPAAALPLPPLPRACLSYGPGAPTHLDLGGLSASDWYTQIRRWGPTAWSAAEAERDAIGLTLPASLVRRATSAGRGSLHALDVPAVLIAKALILRVLGGLLGGET